MSAGEICKHCRHWKESHNNEYGCCNYKWKGFSCDCGKYEPLESNLDFSVFASHSRPRPKQNAAGISQNAANQQAATLKLAEMAITQNNMIETLKEMKTRQNEIAAELKRK